MTVAIVCAAILGALVFALGANVSRLRGAAARSGGSQMPTDPADRLLIAVRAHGNAAEYVPTFMVLFLLLGWRSPGILASVLIIGATLARLVHAIGMLTAPTLAAESRQRTLGAAGTYLFGLALAVMVFVTVL
jgi:uncharacterized membrane protein YecN with MAPEG domain